MNFDFRIARFSPVLSFPPVSHVSRFTRSATRLLAERLLAKTRQAL